MGNSAGLRKSNGNVNTPPIEKTVSALRVLIPNAKEIPDQAKPKKASVKKMPITPRIPVVTVAPKANASASIMAD